MFQPKNHRQGNKKKKKKHNELVTKYPSYCVDC